MLANASGSLIHRALSTTREVPCPNTKNVGARQPSEPAVALNLTSYLDFSRKDYSGPPIKKLIDVINHVKPTALFGLSTVKVHLDMTKSPVTVLTNVL